MRKILFIFTLISFLTFGFVVLAQDRDLPDPGLTPDNPFYFLKVWKEKIQLFFTFGEENKAKQYLHLADVRLAEYQKMVERGKTEIAQKTLEKYEKQLNQALEKTDQVQDKGKDVTKLKEEISEKILKHQEVLEGVLEKVPEEAKSGIEKAIEASQKGFEKAIEAVTEEKKEELEEKAEEIQNRIEEKAECQQYQFENRPCPDSDGKRVYECKCVEGKWSCPSLETVCPKPSELRYYTCPDGTKVVSGECYGEGERMSCNILMSPELKCPAPMPPVTAGAGCPIFQEIKYYTCPDNTQVIWCWCYPKSGSTANVWQCQHLPELSCGQATATPTPASPPTPTPQCKPAEPALEDYKCADGTLLKWQCTCSISEDGEEEWNCEVNPPGACPASVAPLTISNLWVRYRLWILKESTVIVHHFWKTNVPANSYIEYGPTSSYGFTTGYTASPAAPITNHGTNGLPEAQRNTTYHFRIVAEDTDGNRVISDDYTFTTGVQQ